MKVFIVVFLAPMLGLLFSWISNAIALERYLKEQERIRKEITKNKPKVIHGYFEEEK